MRPEELEYVVTSILSSSLSLITAGSFGAGLQGQPTPGFFLNRLYSDLLFNNSTSLQFSCSSKKYIWFKLCPENQSFSSKIEMVLLTFRSCTVYVKLLFYIRFLCNSTCRRAKHSNKIFYD